MLIETIKNRAEFISLSNKGSKIFNDNIVFIAIKNDTDSIRLGFTASKKIGNSPERNRAKRRLRAASRFALEDVKSSYDILLIARKKILISDFNEIVSDIKNSLYELKII